MGFLLSCTILATRLTDLETDELFLRVPISPSYRLVCMAAHEKAEQRASLTARLGQPKARNGDFRLFSSLAVCFASARARSRVWPSFAPASTRAVITACSGPAVSTTWDISKPGPSVSRATERGQSGRLPGSWEFHAASAAFPLSGRAASRKHLRHSQRRLTVCICLSSAAGASAVLFFSSW